MPKSPCSFLDKSLSSFEIIICSKIVDLTVFAEEEPTIAEVIEQQGSVLVPLYVVNSTTNAECYETYIYDYLITDMQYTWKDGQGLDNQCDELT